MPIEIRELQVRVNVRGDGENSTESSAQGDESAEVDREELIQEVMDQVDEKLKNKKER